MWHSNKNLLASYSLSKLIFETILTAVTQIWPTMENHPGF
jgi:hypothetical protein